MIIAKLVSYLIAIYLVLLFVRVLFAWIRPNMFNPIVRFVYSLTNPYLRLFAGLRFLRIREIDCTPIFAFFLLYLLMKVLYVALLWWGLPPWNLVVSLVIVLLFRLAYFILLVFIVATGLRFVIELIGLGTNNLFVAVVYSLSEPAVRPFRRLLGARSLSGYGPFARFDPAALLSLAVFILARFFALPKLYAFIDLALG